MGVAVTRTDVVSGDCGFLVELQAEKGPVDIRVNVDAVNFVSAESDVKLVLQGKDQDGIVVKAKLTFDKTVMARSLQRWLTFEAGLPRLDHGKSSDS